MKKAPQPWQLAMFQQSLKKQQKLKALLEYTGDRPGKDYLLVTCGDNTGALNWHFRQHGGNWVWADLSGENNDQIAVLLGEPVHTLAEDCFPFPDEQFDGVVAIDVLEHLSQDQPFLGEVRRVLKRGGRAVVTVPNGDPKLLANRIKWRVGMSLDDYGHTRAGYTIDELSQAVSQAGFTPRAWGGYSRFFTEMIELGINYSYTHILSKKRGRPMVGHIAPVTHGEVNQHKIAFRLYGYFFPLIQAFSRLDLLLPQKSNNAVIVVAEKMISQ